MAWSALAAPGTAQDLSDRWDVVGTYTVAVADESLQLFAVVDTESGSGTLSHDIYGGYEVIQVTGVAADQNGEPGVPILTVTLGPYSGEIPQDISVEFREADRVLMANIDSETSATLDEVRLTEHGGLEFSFSAELAVMTPTADGAFEPAAGAVPTMISGSFVGTLPAE